MTPVILPPLAHWLAWWRGDTEIVHDSVEAYLSARKIRDAEYDAAAEAGSQVLRSSRHPGAVRGTLEAAIHAEYGRRASTPPVAKVGGA